VAGGGPLVAKWRSLADPLSLVLQTWEHGAQIRAAFSNRKLAWPVLTSQEIGDMLVYLQSLPETATVSRTLQPPPMDSGEKLFQSKGCAECHTGANAPENLMKNDARVSTSPWGRARGSSLQDRLLNQTLTDIAVDLWNHQPDMQQPPSTLAPEEMRQIIAYIWARQYFTGKGNAPGGKRVFTEKHCATCHDDLSSGAPKLERGKDAHPDITMVAALWQHGPRMLELMNERNLSWPRFTAQQMTDLIA
jgi:mono/diheme cytochrome c family protein